VRQCADGIAGNDAAVIENFLELRSGFNALVCGLIGPATHVDRIEGPLAKGCKEGSRRSSARIVLSRTLSS
jgi:hypothetical protein